MIMLYFLAWNGGVHAEQVARSRFADFLAASQKAAEESKRVVEESEKVEEERKAVVEERVLRFNAERELDQTKGTWYPTSSGADPAQPMPRLVGSPGAHTPEQDVSSLLSSTI